MPLKDRDARKAYHREYMRTRWYPANKELHVRRVGRATARRQAALAERINAVKARPCADCGIQYPPNVMDFDHILGDKVTGICEMRRRTFEWGKILAEIATCEVVCANCHRLRTYRRRLASPAGT